MPTANFPIPSRLAELMGSSKEALGVLKGELRDVQRDMEKTIKLGGEVTEAQADRQKFLQGRIGDIQNAPGGLESLTARDVRHVRAIGDILEGRVSAHSIRGLAHLGEKLFGDTEVAGTKVLEGLMKGSLWGGIIGTVITRQIEGAIKQQWALEDARIKILEAFSENVRRRLKMTDPGIEAQSREIGVIAKQRVESQSQAFAMMRARLKQLYPEGAPDDPVQETYFKTMMPVYEARALAEIERRAANPEGADVTAVRVNQATQEQQYRTWFWHRQHDVQEQEAVTQNMTVPGWGGH